MIHLNAGCISRRSDAGQGASLTQALWLVRLLDGGQVRRIEDGPYGGTPLMVGEELAGEMITSTHEPDGGSWGAVRVEDYSLAQTAYALTMSMLWLPGFSSPLKLKVAALSNLGSWLVSHLDIAETYRGHSRRPHPTTATYPSLWNHNARNETRMVCTPDSQLLVGQEWKRKQREFGPPPAEHI